MATITGNVLTTTGFGRQDDIATLLAKVSWTAAPTTSDTLEIQNAIPDGQKLAVDDFEVFGTIPDSNSAQTFALKAGTEDDDDAFIPATVIDQTGQFFLKGTGAAIGGTITDQTNLIITPTADAATAVATGDFFIRFTGRLQTK